MISNIQIAQYVMSDLKSIYCQEISGLDFAVKFVGVIFLKWNESGVSFLIALWNLACTFLAYSEWDWNRLFAS